MSRFAIVCSLVFGLASSSLVTSAHAQFARPPGDTPVASPTVASSDVPVPPSFGAPIPIPEQPMPDGHEHAAQMRIAPRATPSRTAVRAALVKARAANLASFRVYVRTGVFPNNTMSDEKLNVWRDDDGHICAAATIIQMSGHGDLVDRVALDNNFIRLADVTQGPVMDWILTSGFTQDEIAMIQEPFMPVRTDEPRDPAFARKPSVDPTLRGTENARLRAKYKAIDRALVKNARKNLDNAVDRLMKSPNLAWQLVDAQS